MGFPLERRRSHGRAWHPALGLLIAGVVLLWAWNRKAAALTRGEFSLAGAGVGH